MESKGESLRAEIEELVDYVSTNNVTKLLDNDQDYKSGFRDLVLKLNDMVTQQGEMYERIKGADAAFGNMHKFDFFVNELESIDKNINNLDFLNDMDSIEESIQLMSGVIESINPSSLIKNLTNIVIFFL